MAQIQSPPPSPNNAHTVVRALKQWTVERALPLWSGAGWDSRRGGFIERLCADGRPDGEAPRRVRVQARQIYCFAKAARLGWFPQGRETALRGLQFLLEKARDGRPGFPHLLDPDGAVVDDLRDAYDHAFILLALATVYDLTKDSQVRHEIDETTSFLDSSLRSPHGGFNEGLPASLPRRQNPHMHLFEAMLALYAATDDLAFQQRAGDFYALFVANLFDARTELLGEYYEEDWARISPVVVEPGHHAEWTWLLWVFERNTGCPTSKYRAALMRAALQFRDEATECLIDECDGSGRVTKPTMRLWPQTEIAKAYLAQAEAEELGAAMQAREALVRLYRYYLDHPVPGGWYDQFDREHRSLVDFIPASSFYHVLCAIAEADRVLG